MSIGDPAASLDPAAIRTEAVHLATEYSPWAAGRSNAESTSTPDVHGSPAEIRRANEASMIIWHGWRR